MDFDLRGANILHTGNVVYIICVKAACTVQKNPIKKLNGVPEINRKITIFPPVKLHFPPDFLANLLFSVFKKYMKNIFLKT